MPQVLLGCIADDFTGATDLANNLVRGGMRVVQAVGVPGSPLDGAADAVVIALKSRTIAAKEAIAQSLAALRWLQAQGCPQFFFKYCSTFDSTPAGNIGPVTEALMDALGADFTVAAPAFPENARTVFKGHLFVGDVLLNESGMQNHPLTPMKDPNLVRVLQAQCRRKVGLFEHATVARGAKAIIERSVALKAAGVGVAIADAVSNDDLLRLGAALKDLPLVTGGSGLAIGLPANFGLKPSNAASELPRAGGLRAIVSGSCSGATNRQVEEFVSRGGDALAVDPLRLASGQPVVQEALAWAEPRLARGPVLVYSTAAADAVKAVQGRLGCEGAGELVEQALATIASGLVQCGVRQLAVAGGETSGACVQALGIEQLQIGPQIDPGVPWCHAAARHAPGGLHLALKSGNFGTDDFFIKAFAKLACGEPAEVPRFAADLPRGLVRSLVPGALTAAFGQQQTGRSSSSWRKNVCEFLRRTFKTRKRFCSSSELRLVAAMSSRTCRGLDLAMELGRYLVSNSAVPRSRGGLN